MSNLWGGPPALRGCSRARFGLILPGLLLAGCGSSLTRHGPIDPALAVFIPPDTIALAGVHLDQIRGTPIYRKLAAENRLPRFDQFDLGRDINDLLLTSDGKNALVIAHGDFAAKPGAPADPTGAFTFVGKNIALAGPAAAVHAAIDRSKSGVHAAPRELMTRAEALPADAQIWAVVVGWKGATPGQLREMGNLANLDRVLRLVESASLTVDLRSGVHAAFTGASRTDADAKTLADSLRGLASLARMGAQRKPDLVRAFDGIQVKQDGRVVQVNVDIAEDLAEKLAR
jgi:hypothetical protein